MIRSESQLAALAGAFLSGNARLSLPEAKLLKRAVVLPSDIVESTRALITAGEDPLGEMFCQIRTAESRRNTGATYTPGAIVTAMIAWAADERSTPARIVDPGTGSGRFLIAAAKAFPKAKLVGVEIDPLAALIVRANAEVLGFTNRLDLRLEDFRTVELKPIKGPTLFIGNPPYVRHHDISERWKTWFGKAAADLGFSASKLAGLHVHFFIRTRQLGRPGDFGAYITAAEWLDVNYGSVLRQMLGNGLGGTSLHVINPTAQPFADAMTTAAIACFRVGNRPDEFTIRAVDSLDQLAPLSAGRIIPWSEVENSSKWTSFTRTVAPRPSGFMEIGELFRVHRGQVTGNNAVWVAGEAAAELPASFLLPAVTRARELLANDFVLSSTKKLQRVVCLPTSFEGLTIGERQAVDRFLKWAKRQGAHLSYVAVQRAVWWAVRYKDPAPILATYMARRAPHFVRNAAKARHLNIAHGLYPRDAMSPESLDQIVRFLQTYATTEGGRTYAGGLVKFEPGEMERIAIPRLETLNEIAAEMDHAATKGRRARGDGHLPT